ncbi:hypothetical protein PPN31114_00567 [Pandoraea pneumonica]|uniref:Lipoprotein n=2 Tax=Pandoraea pneumonica TaxID=2508299 RepID=A0A5E4S7J2_9BURK|nr:hypothetical protein PPN31114_00567 [Pandoraea pneumonica]
MRATFVCLVLLLAGPAMAQSSNCDCQQIVGACAASVRVVPTDAKKGSYGADLLITSTAPTCSKVDYFVDGTPYFTILNQGNTGEDRVFGQKPISRENVSSISCHVCASTTPRSAPAAQPVPARTNGLDGQWHAAACPGAPGWWGSGGPARDVTISLSLRAGQVVGTLDEHSAAYSYTAQLSGASVAEGAKLQSSVGSSHQMTLSADGKTLTDHWCNKDGGCAVCLMERQ